MNNNIIINDKIQANINYSGNVTIKYINKANGKVEIISKHNTPNDGLFTCITKMLSRLNFSTYMPSRIMGYSEAGEELFTQPISYASTPNVVYIDSTGQEIFNSPVTNALEYTFVIPFNNIRDTTSAIKTLTLFNDISDMNSDESKCATVTLETPISTNIDSGILIY